MKFVKPFILIFIGCFLVLSAHAATKIEMVAGLSKPPFVIQENGTGIQLDMTKAAFKTQNIEVKFIHIPFGRSIMSFQRFEVDGLITVPKEYQHPGMYLSKPYVHYQNVAISLVEDNYSIDSIEDLSGKSIIAFQRARKYLGEDYNKIVKNLVGYRELAEQAEQVATLFYRQSEVIILDENIFKHLIKDSEQFSEPVKVHRIFPKRTYSAGFKTEKLRNAFDQGMSEIIENGTYQKILDKYLK